MVVGTDANVQPPMNVQGITGSKVWERKDKGPLYRRQADAVLRFCREFCLTATNTWETSETNPPTKEELGEEGDIQEEMFKRSDWADKLEATSWTWAQGELKDKDKKREEIIAERKKE